ncbi:MAG: OmpA family protein [Gammaproteobacteria bacterium]
MKKLFYFCVAGILGISFTLTGCMTTNPYTGQQEVSDTTLGTGIGAAGGAIVGGLINGGKGALIGAALGGATGAVIGNSMDNANKELRQRLVGSGVQVRKIGNSVQLVMYSDVLFKTDSADINRSFYNSLSSVALVLKKYNNTNVMVSGFTDSTGSASHNQILSEERAKSVANFLASQGVNQNRLFSQGFGMRNPVASNSTATGRAQNRRVVIILRPAG